MREKFAYGMGDVGSNLLLCVGTLYLLKFYTDVLEIPAAWGGVDLSHLALFYGFY
ncbi:Uncharacterized symporter yihO [Yersinia aldovae ATCC 35236]|nr:Uncharacterized symporter yihO [Yersinia aldovae ATCC 35236]